MAQQTDFQPAMAAGDQPDPLAAARAAFDLPSDVTYLNCAFMGPMPASAMEAGLSGLARKGRPWTIAPDDFTVPVDQLRAAFAGLLGVPADVDGIAITPSVSYGTSTAAANLHLDDGQVAVVLEQQFPSDVYPWEQLARRHGGRLHAVARPRDGDWTAAVLTDLDRLGGKVGVVSVPPCHWIDGGLVDLVAVGAAARSVGAALVVDVCQWLGAAPFDVGAIRPDFVVGATYKWLCGPYSVGFLWAAPQHRSGVPIEHGWTSRANSHCLACLADYTEEYQPGARRYDVGEVANFTLVPAALAAAELVTSWDPARVAVHAARLTARVALGAGALGLTMAPAHLRAPHLMGLRLAPTVDAEAMAPALADEGVHVSVRGDAIRVSAHAFNTDGDVDHLLAALAATLGTAR
ncbi:MAG: class aminotransferase [Acidimicrobiales bacterium]|nr:class aminotransferase [Acidimicrobiales bacterium]